MDSKNTVPIKISFCNCLKPQEIALKVILRIWWTGQERHIWTGRPQNGNRFFLTLFFKDIYLTVLLYSITVTGGGYSTIIFLIIILIEGLL